VQIAPHNEEAVILLLNQVQAGAAKADAFVVTSPEHVKEATNELSIIAGLKRAVDVKLREYTGPINEHLINIRASFKLLSEPLDYADRLIRGKVTAYTIEQNRKRDEAIAIAREKQAIADREAALNGEEAKPVETSPIPAPAPAQTTAELGTSNMMDVWKYEVIDFALLSDTYKVADTALLNSEAKKHHDSKIIPGVRFYNEPTLRVERFKE